MHKLIKELRMAGIAEGVSFLILLFIAMPMKYMGGMPLAVTIAGSLHGFLFIVYMVSMIRTGSEFEWKGSRYGQVVLAAVIPFGTFVLDSKLKKEELELKNAEESGKVEEETSQQSVS